MILPNWKRNKRNRKRSGFPRNGIISALRPRDYISSTISIVIHNPYLISAIFLKKNFLDRHDNVMEGHIGHCMVPVWSTCYGKMLNLTLTVRQPIQLILFTDTHSRRISVDDECRYMISPALSEVPWLMPISCVSHLLQIANLESVRIQWKDRPHDHWWPNSWSLV